MGQAISCSCQPSNQRKARQQPPLEKLLAKKSSCERLPTVFRVGSVYFAHGDPDRHRMLDSQC